MMSFRGSAKYVVCPQSTIWIL